MSLRSAILALMLVSNWTPSSAGFVRPVTSDVAIEVDSAPVRAGYPAGRILAVLHKGTVVKVVEAWANGDGVWLEIKIKIGDLEQSAYVAKNQTNFTDPVNLSEEASIKR